MTKTEKLTIRMTPEQMAKAKRRARARKTTMTSLALEGLVGSSEEAERAMYEQGREDERAALLEAASR